MFRTESYVFPNATSFLLAQSIKSADDELPGDCYPVNVTGVLRLQPASISADEFLRVKLEVHASDSALADMVQVEHTDGHLSVEVPGFVPALEASHKRPCISVAVIASIGPAASFESFGISSTVLDIEFSPALCLVVNDSIRVKSCSGNVRALGSSPCSSRRTIINLISGNIHGTYGLLDLLSLHTVSGTISVSVTPQAASPTKPAPAEFIAETFTGQINVDLPGNTIIDHLPSRDYRVRVTSKSGSLSGRYLLGTHATFHSLSGSISTVLLPVPADCRSSNISSRTVSGSIDIRILSPFILRGVPMKLLSGDHKSTSGGIQVQYPKEWEGHIDAQSVSGHIDVRGEAVNIIQERRGRVLARKGDGFARVACNTVSGSLDVEVK